MATIREWTNAYLAQAHEALEAAKVLAEKGIPSAFCMLLQMVFEKLAKAALGVSI
jgi:HEPN domain-containing protein